MVLGFIPALLAEDYKAFWLKLSIIGLMWICVIIATVVDIITGISASKRVSNTKITSSGLRKTLTKNVQYIGVLICALMLDIVLSYLSEYVSIFNVPLITIIAVIVECAIETISVNENIHKGKTGDINAIKLTTSIVKNVTTNENVKNTIEVIEKITEEHNKIEQEEQEAEEKTKTKKSKKKKKHTTKKEKKE